MRVATAQSYDAAISRLNQQQAQMLKSQEQVATGKKVLRISDDPVAATQSERATNRLARVETDQRMLEASRTSLTQIESALGEATEAMHSVRELMVAAGNPALSASDRVVLADQIQGLRDQLLAVANRTDTNGNPLFGGLGGSPKPFADLYSPSGRAVQFNGQLGQAAATETALPLTVDGRAAWMRLNEGNGQFVVNLAAGNTGTVVGSTGTVVDEAAVAAASTAGRAYEVQFQAGTSGGVAFRVVDTSSGAGVAPYASAQTYQPVLGTRSLTFEGMELTLTGTPAAGDVVTVNFSQPRDVFTTLEATVAALRQTGGSAVGAASAQLSQALANGLKELDSGFEATSALRSQVGQWLQRADTLEADLGQRTDLIEGEKARVEDLDMTKGISDFNLKQVGYQAALQSYAQIKKLSMFDYLR